MTICCQWSLVFRRKHLCETNHFVSKKPLLGKTAGVGVGSVGLKLSAVLGTLLDKVGCVVIGDFQMDQHHLMLKELIMRPYMATKKKKVCLKQNISIGSHCMA